MPSFNKAIIMGNLARDPESKYLQNGDLMVRITVAVDKNKRVGDEWTTETSFINATLFKESAERVFNRAVKGDLILVEGRLEQRSWTTDKGEKRSMIEISGDRVCLFPKGVQAEQNQAFPSYANQGAQKRRQAPAPTPTPPPISTGQEQWPQADSEQDIPF